MNKFNQKDLLILSSLRKNARNSLTNISKNTRIPISTIFDRLKEHEKEIIIKHTALLNFNRLGYQIKALAAIKTIPESKEELKKHLSLNKNVNNLFVVNNQHDFLVEIICKNLKELIDFFEQLENRFKIIKKEEYMIVEDVKREKFLSNELLLEVDQNEDQL